MFARAFRATRIAVFPSRLSTPRISNRYRPRIKIRRNSLTRNEKIFSNRYFFSPFQRFVPRKTVRVSLATPAGAPQSVVFDGRSVERIPIAAAERPSVRFSVESEAKKKEGVSQQLCLAGQKGDTPCHLKAGD
jgi:hypothetical protein